MTPERWNHIKQIVDEAIELESQGRPASISGMCGGDSELAAEVDRLLSDYRKISGFLEIPAAEVIFGGARAFEPGQIAAGRYEIVSLLGEGGMGEVWEARDQELRGKRVALKALRDRAAGEPRFARRMTEEVLLAREITHPNVCPIYDIGLAESRSGKVPFLVMKLIEGRSLKQVLEERGRLPAAEALRIAAQIADGLDAAHRAGVVHRDLKPGNIMIQSGAAGSEAIVTDFGLASSVNPANGILTPAVNSAIVGTPGYMAPEQHIPGSAVTPASDLYAFGLMIHEMTTGRLPAAAGIDREALPYGWPAILTRCLANEPKQRFASALDVVRALKQSDSRRQLGRTASATAIAISILAALFFSGGYRALRRLISPLPSARHAVVLPFRNASGDPAWDPIAAGITDTVATELLRAQQPGENFWVLANADVTTQHVTSPAQANQVFGTNLAIVGTLGRQGETARLRVETVTSPGGRTLISRDLVAPSAEIYRLTGQAASEAASMLDVAYRPDPGSAAGAPKAGEPYRLYEAANAAMRTQDAKQVDQAIALFSQALDLDPGYAFAYGRLANAYAARWIFTREPGLIDLADRSIERAISLNGNSSTVRESAAAVANTFRRHQKSIEEAGRCLALAPSDAQCTLFMADAYDGLGKTDEAEKTYRSAIALWPHHWLLYNRFGGFYFRHTRYADAEKMFQMTIQTAAWNPLGYTNLAGLYLATKRYAEAAELLQTSNRLRPTGSGLSNLGTSYFYLGRYAESAAEFEKAAKLEPGRHERWYNLGDAYAKLPDASEKPRDCYRRALDLLEKQQRTAPARENLATEALYRAKLGDGAGARKALAEAQITNSDPGLRFREARVRELIGDRDGALQALGQALSAGFSRTQIAEAPELDRLRADPRYIKMTTK